MSDLPEKVNAMHIITYDVNEVRSSLAELNGIDQVDVRDYEITNLIQTWIAEDFGNAENLIVQDENGEEVNW